MARGRHSRRTFLSWHPLQHGPGGQFSGPQADSCEPRRPGEPSKEGAGFSSEPRGHPGGHTVTSGDPQTQGGSLTRMTGQKDVNSGSDQREGGREAEREPWPVGCLVQGPPAPRERYAEAGSRLSDKQGGQSGVPPGSSRLLPPWLSVPASPHPTIWGASLPSFPAPFSLRGSKTCILG